MALGAYAKHKQQKKASQEAKKARDKQRSQTLGYAGSKNYLANLDTYRKAFQSGYLPALRTQGETSALEEQSALQGIDAEAARRGISGGTVDALRAGARSSRSARYDQAVRDYMMEAEQAARGEAGATTNRQTGASGAAPYYYVGGPGNSLNAWSNVLSAAAQGYGGQQANLGGGSGSKYQWLGQQTQPNYG